MKVHPPWEGDVLPKALIGAPCIQHEESVASWIQHVCASHQYSIGRLESILRVKPRFHDWDLRVNASELNQVLEWTDYSSDDFLAALASVQNYSASMSRRRYKELLQGPPVYRWCPDCLDQDERPYLRWWWRLPERVYCLAHQRNLVSKCSMCSSELVLSHALMVNTGKRFAVSDFSICHGCGLPRVQADPRDESLPFDVVSHPDQHKPNLKPWLPKKLMWGKDKYLADSLCTTLMPRTGAWRPALKINAAVFQTEPSMRLASEREKWSSRFGRELYPTRDKLAYALGLIRKEMRLERGERRCHPAVEDDRHE